MELAVKLDLLVRLGEQIKSKSNLKLEHAIQKSFVENPWFTNEQVEYALNSIAENYLTRTALQSFADRYQFAVQDNPKKVALIPAGNIPLVGFHDMLCVFLSGHICQIKVSTKDKFLTPVLVDLLTEMDNRVSQYVSFVEQLKNFDAVIATGSDNTSRYFEYYFGKYPNVIRKNRNGIAVLSGEESDQNLTDLSHDVFRYFGLGCRNISKIYVPRSFDIKRLFDHWKGYNHYINHNKYANNFEYNSANLILSQQDFLTNNIFILKENDAIVSRISTIHYAYYDDISLLEKSLQSIVGQIQCVATNLDLESLPVVPIGQAQVPSLFDFADGVDTVQFLNSI